jgi:nitroreductase
LDILFKALQLAASGNNYQNWEFVFVRDPEVKQRLVPACSNQRFIRDCTYFIAGVAVSTLKWHMVDITIALTQFALQAVELGYGTCWIRRLSWGMGPAGSALSMKPGSKRF